MLGLKLNHVSKSGHRPQRDNTKNSASRQEPIFVPRRCISIRCLLYHGHFGRSHCVKLFYCVSAILREGNPPDIRPEPKSREISPFPNIYLSWLSILKLCAERCSSVPQAYCRCTCTWWRHQMEIFPRYWPFIRGTHPPMDSPHKWPVTRSIAVFFDLCMNKQLSKQSRRRRFGAPSRSLWRHCNDHFKITE